MSAPDTDARLIAIESMLMQLQYDVDQLSSALRAQQADVQDLQKGLIRISAALAEQTQEPAGPAHDPPPHY
jgi:uncharacterized coiled-coil protein SlyX